MEEIEGVVKELPLIKMTGQEDLMMKYHSAINSGVFEKQIRTQGNFHIVDYIDLCFIFSYFLLFSNFSVSAYRFHSQIKYIFLRKSSVYPMHPPLHPPPQHCSLKRGF